MEKIQCTDSITNENQIKAFVSIDLWTFSPWKSAKNCEKSNEILAHGKNTYHLDWLVTTKRTEIEKDVLSFAPNWWLLHFKRYEVGHNRTAVTATAPLDTRFIQILFFIHCFNAKHSKEMNSFLGIYFIFSHFWVNGRHFNDSPGDGWVVI